MNTIEKTAQSVLTHPVADIRSGYGWKFLTPWGSTEGRDTPGIAHKRGQTAAADYELPRPAQKWGEWQVHPQPNAPDGQDCGAGRWLVMKKLDARYAPKGWWPWFAEYRGVIGESEEKAGVSELRLRRVRPQVFWRIARFGRLSGADLSGANLSEAYLSGANLSGAYLSSADLSDANLRNVDLGSANLRNANLRRADLRNADLSNADLRNADLSNADLRNADLSNADLRNADLSKANLRRADLYRTNLRGANLIGTNLSNEESNQESR